MQTKSDADENIWLGKIKMRQSTNKNHKRNIMQTAWCIFFGGKTEQKTIESQNKMQSKTHSALDRSDVI